MKNKTDIIIKQSILLLRITLFSIILIQLFSCKNISNNDKHLQIVFRFDDYSNFSNTEIEQKIINTFDSLDIKLSLAVIPFRNDNKKHEISENDIKLNLEKANFLKKAYKKGVVDIALHGYNHTAIDYNTPWTTEFKGLDYDLQKERIIIAKQYLESVIEDKIKIFVPPWNSYDENTIKILCELGFEILSASADNEALKEYNIKYLPFTCELHQLKEAIEAVKKNTKNNPAVIVALFHASDFSRINYDYPQKISLIELYDMLIWLKSLKNTEILTISELAQKDTNLGASRLMDNRRIHLKSQYIPPYIFKGKWYRYYDNYYDFVNTALSAFLILYYSFMAVIAFLIIKLAGKILKSRRTFAQILNYFLWLLAIGTIIYAGHDFDINYRGLSVIVLMSSISISLIIYFKNFRCKKINLSHKK